MVEKEVDLNTNIGTDPQTDIESEKKHKEITLKKQNRQLIWAVFLMVSVIVIIIAVPYLRDNVFNKFNYEGITFQKTKIGDLTFYNTNLPVYHQPVSLSSATGMVVDEIPGNDKDQGGYLLTLREDPRELDNIKSDLDINNITFIKSKTVYVTYNASDPICEHNVISAADIARFLLNFGKLDAEGATVNKEYADENKIPYITCDNSPDHTVINMVAGNESRIFKVKDNCYELMYANCDMVGVTDKFIVNIIEGYLNSVKQNDKYILDSSSSQNKS